MKFLKFLLIQNRIKKRRASMEKLLMSTILQMKIKNRLSRYCTVLALVLLLSYGYWSNVVVHVKGQGLKIGKIIIIITT